MAGIDHSLAPIDIRSLFSFSKKSMAELLPALRERDGISGCVLLSTCNRTELYLDVEESFAPDPAAILCELKGLSPDTYSAYLKTRRDREAVSHLFRLSCGLESRILGDDQIVTQVKEALEFARAQYTTDHVLETLFRQAVTAAKKVKTENALFAGDRSVVRAAIDSLKEQGYSFSEKNCMVIGNGVVGKLAASALAKEGAAVTVTVRQYRSGVVEIPSGCARIDYGRRMELFGSCDYVVSATVSPNYTLTKELIEQNLVRPVVLIDLAVPRDIEPAAAELDQVTLFDVDMFREEASPAQREAVRRAEKCLDEQMDAFYDWYNCLDVLPQIQTIKKEFGTDTALRLTKQIKSLPLSDSDKEELRGQIEGAAERAANKLLFDLRAAVDQDVFRAAVDALDTHYKEEDA